LFTFVKKLVYNFLKGEKMEKLALAAFLHDIGKFAQRAEAYKFFELDDFEKSFAICDKNKCSYYHAAFTARVLTEMGLDGIENLVVLASSHHKKNLNKEENIIKLADKYSSAERKESESSDFKKTNLFSIFSEVGLCSLANEYYFDIQKFDENIAYPTTNKTSKNNVVKYKKLYDKFKKDAKSLELDFEKKTTQSFLNLKSLLEKYTTFIPSSSYKSYPDVSLFDHLLSTAAIASAIYLGNEKKFFLIQGDFSSIQNFIFSKYGESNKYLAKILRAKSLFVTLATEMIALKVCRELGLTPLSIVMNAGGKFTIIAPKIDEKKLNEILNNIKREINKEFLKINFLQTHFILDYVEEEFKNLSFGNASKVMEKMAKKFEASKLKFDEEIEVFESYIDELSKKEKCSICGIVPTDEEIEEDVYVCKFCKKFKDLGQKLPKVKYIKLDLNKGIFEGIDLVDEIEEESENIIYYSMNENDNFAIKRVANYVPIIEEKKKVYELIKDKSDSNIGDIKSFYHIAVDGLEEKEDGFYGRKYLAILKADVDNLGQVFIYGFKKIKKSNDIFPIKYVSQIKNYDEIVDEATFSRVVSLSRFMDFYFTTILKKKIKEKYKNIYTVFAGGDDLFLIGHYKDIINLHKEFLEDFKKYTQNKDLHLSYAIRFTSPDVPLNQMAEFAESDLEEAKEGLKDRSVIFGVKVKNSELPNLYALEDEFRRMDYLSDSFLYKLYMLIEMRENIEENPIKNARWKALFNYFLKKNVKKEYWEEAGKIGEWIERYGEKLKIPLNLYLYSKRKYKKD
jgi:CRISPR-associated protein Csm1